MAERSRLAGWHPESEFRRLIEQVADYINTPTTERKLLMALQADVQKLVDEVKQNTDLAKASAQALQIQGQQIDALKTQIGTLQAGQVLTAEDLTAIQGLVGTVGETNTELQAAVPANAAPAPAPEPAPADQPPPANP